MFMQYKVGLVLILCTIFLSCKTTSNPTAPENAGSSLWPMKVGNSWTFRYAKTDTNGTPISYEDEVFRVTGTKRIAGVDAWEVVRTWPQSSGGDDSFYMAFNNTGDFVSFTDTSATSDTLGFWRVVEYFEVFQAHTPVRFDDTISSTSVMHGVANAGDDTTITVVAGTFSVRQIVTRDSSVYNDVGSGFRDTTTYSERHYFIPNIGPALYTRDPELYTTSAGDRHLRHGFVMELKSYHIE